MPRYITRPKANDDWHARTLPALPHPVVYPQEPTYTGLHDSDDNPIYRAPDPIGYLRLK